MMSLPFRFLASAVAVLALPVLASAAEPAILAKARARIGSEAAIERLKSIHYTGTLVTTDPKDPTKEMTAKVDMVFVKPDFQRITAVYDTFVESTALDSYEGWTRVQDGKDATKWRLTLLDADQVKRLRANTWETLAFFRGIERIGGRVEDQGPATIEGVACQKIAFIHSEKIIFYKYFEQATGRLVLTETESGATLREQGELVVDGLRFPKTLVTMVKNGDNTQKVTLNYDKITLNETFPPDGFRVPPLGRN